jgi:hypothetical protein
MAEMRPQLPHRAVETGDTAVRARLHHAALRRRPRELGEFAAFEALGHPQVCLKQTLFHCSTRLCNGLGGTGTTSRDRLPRRWCCRSVDPHRGLNQTP